MKDLFVLTADADAEALLRAVLNRHKALQIRPIAFDIRRFTGRDSGMVKEGPEIARVLVNKLEYSRLLLVWDHEGSGWDGASWLGRSSAVVLVPELEELLWNCPRSIAVHLGISDSELKNLTEIAAAKLAKPVDRCRREFPKELFEIVFYSKKRRQPLPEDFKSLGSSADLKLWSRSEAFSRLH